ncbi:hypothetical protein [Rhodoferax sp.]|nr:hypothetical protein [Rhodoferax sp.]MCM2295160.1 hypothetical protein [Rhodoferax sp.]
MLAHQTASQSVITSGRMTRILRHAGQASTLRRLLILAWGRLAWVGARA